MARALLDRFRARWSALAQPTGRAREALELLAEGIARVQSHEDRWWEPELYRTLGELLEQPDGAAAAEAERHLSAQPMPSSAADCFARALTLARQMGARAFELRAATSWAALHQAQGEPERAHALLAPVCGTWPASVDTEDVRRARGLLATLRR